MVWVAPSRLLSSMAVMELSPSATLLLTEGKKATAMATVMSKNTMSRPALRLVCMVSTLLSC